LPFCSAWVIGHGMTGIQTADRTAPVVFGDPRLHTDGDVLALSFAPDGSLWSVEEPGLVRQWDGQGRQLRWHFLSEWETLWAFRSDARLLASAGRELSLWDPQSGRLLATWPQPSWVTALAFAPQGELLATGHDDGRLRLWDVHRLRLLAEQQLHPLPISALAFRPDGQQLASAGEDRLILLWDVRQQQVCGRLEGHTDRIAALLWHPDGRQLISAGWDTTARIWDAVTQQPLILLNTHALQVQALALSADGKLLASADSEQHIHVWDFAARQEIQVLLEREMEVCHLAFSPEGRRLAAAGLGRVIHLWDPQTGKSLTAGTTWGRAQMALALSPDGRRLVLNGGGLDVQVWDTARQTLLFPLPEQEVTYALAWSPDGAWILGGTDSGIRRWHAATGRPHDLLEGPEEPPTVLAVAPAKNLLASANSQDLAVWLWNLDSGEPLLLIPDPLEGCGVTSLAFEPTGRFLVVGGLDYLATGGSSGGVALWDLEERAEVATLPDGAVQLCLAPQGQRLATATVDHVIGLYDLSRQRLLGELTAHEDTIHALAFHPGGQLLASGGDDFTLCLWDCDHRCLRAAHTLPSQIKALSFSPDGRYLYVGHANTTCCRWELAQLLPG
jgi:WD40 repeat protein